ncbi:hypothetical protein [Alienimonas chondri]|uniref:Uncharacterized protein n=1 Tax=Alienimonas chondri TaxID=2681879 RepID=A0ABX1VLB2_9PLAN|nr:hypothetical protein [Alienimonas chondri]NNJ28115.1 hypothetical protein [Alienimonas chondri]
MTLTSRDAALLVALCAKIRVLSLPQIADAWWPEAADGKAAARRRLGKLAAADLVSRRRVPASPLPPMEAPVVAWKPDGPTPDCGAAAWTLQRRWAATGGPRASTVYLAGAAAAKIYGGASAGKLPAAYQATHDLGVSAMFLRLLRDNPPAAARWIGEDRLAPYRKRQKLPDAVLADGPGSEPELVLEFGGSYDKRRVAAFHQDCARRRLAYEVW